MPALLGLPREIRDSILDAVVEVVPEAFPGTGTLLSDYQTESWCPGNNVRYSNFVPTDMIPTLLVNRQLHDETLDAVKRIRKPRNYELEIVVFEELELVVKWLSVPVLTTQVDTVRATIYNKGICREELSMFKGEEDGPPLGARGLCNVMDRFIKLGPVGASDSTSPRPDKGISIKHLILDIRTPDPINSPQHPAPIGSYSELRHLREQTGIDYVMRPEFVAQFFHQYLSILCSYITSYGSILYERIGRIELLLDGKPYGEPHREFDFARRIASLSTVRRSAAHSEKLKLWKEEICRKRLQCGLCV